MTSVRIAFEVQAGTFKEAERQAELKLAKFLGPDDDPNDWVMYYDCTPNQDVMNGSTILWLVEVTATRR